MFSTCNVTHNNNYWSRGYQDVSAMQPFLSTQELHEAEMYWLLHSQEEYFATEIHALKTHHALTNSSSLLSLRPILDSVGVLRVGGRSEQNSRFYYSSQHPVIVIFSEHLLLLHADLHSSLHPSVVAITSLNFAGLFVPSLVDALFADVRP